MDDAAPLSIKGVEVFVLVPELVPLVDPTTATGSGCTNGSFAIGSRIPENQLKQLVPLPLGPHPV